MDKLLEKIVLGVFFQKIFKNPFLVMDNVLSFFVRKFLTGRTKIDKNKILISTFNGEYTCNPRAIADEILRRNLPYKIVWATKIRCNYANFPKSVTCVLQNSLEFFKQAISSKIWIANGITMTYNNIQKKKSQILIQTWHGAIGIKRFDTNKNKTWIKKIKKDGKITDYCISNSKFETDLYKNTFWQKAKILEFGHARNDVLFKINSYSAINKMIRSRFNIPMDAKLALYAPTFRDNYELDCYGIDYIKLNEALTKKFGGKWVILTRLHSRMKYKQKLMNINVPTFVVNVSEYEDIQDIMAIVDVGITDYSSWICEFILTHKPGFLFATDINTYDNERGFLFPLSDLPYTLAENNEQLEQNILNFNQALFDKRCDEFLAQKGSVDDGKAAERIVDMLEVLLKS